MLDLDEFPLLQQSAEQIEWRDLVPLTELPDELARFDINIAPLERGNPFCEAKSELKYFEAALAGACTVASPTGPMSEAIRNGETGILADTPEDWCEAISALIADAKLRRRLAHAAYLDVLWRYGPHRRAELVSSLLSQITGGQRAAQAFELEFRRQNAPQAGPLDIAPSEVVFVADSLGMAQISTVIPLFNYGGYVTEALESVRAQTVDALDLIVVDDCSTDDSLAVALAWAKEQARTERFNRIVVMRNHVNCGLARTRNAGFDAAETDFVVPLDADNRLLPEFCARTLATLRGSCAAFAYTKIQCFGDQDHLIGTDAFSQMRFAQSNYVDAMALVAKWAWVAVGGYTHIQHGWEDYDFWCCCVERGIWGVHVPEVLAEYRFHSTSMLRMITDVQHNKREVVQHLEARHRWLSIADRGSDITGTIVMMLLLRRVRNLLPAAVGSVSASSGSRPPPLADSFTAHNVRLDDGTETYPAAGWLMSENGIFEAARRLLQIVYPEGLKGRSIVDIGCLEGGFTTEFARLGMVATGIEVRESNYSNCLRVKAGTNLPDLRFVRDDATNISNYGPFDAVFICGLLYHLDRPRQFLADAAHVCRRVLFLENSRHTCRTNAVRRYLQAVGSHGK